MHSLQDVNAQLLNSLLLLCTGGRQSGVHRLCSSSQWTLSHRRQVYWHFFPEQTGGTISVSLGFPLLLHSFVEQTLSDSDSLQKMHYFTVHSTQFIFFYVLLIELVIRSLQPVSKCHRSLNREIFKVCYSGKCDAAPYRAHSAAKQLMYFQTESLV